MGELFRILIPLMSRHRLPAVGVLLLFILAACIALPATQIGEITRVPGEPDSDETLVIVRYDHGMQVLVSAEGSR